MLKMERPRFQTSPYAYKVVWGSAIALVAVLSAGVWGLLHDMYSSTRADSERGLRSFVERQQPAMNRLIGSIDLLLFSVEDILRLTGTPVTEQDPADLQNVLQMTVKQDALISSIAIVQLDGKVLASADSQGNYRLEQIPRNWLQGIAQMQGKERMLRISTPDASWAQMRVLHIARALNTASGIPVFVVAQVPLSSWIGVLVQGSTLNGLEVTLERADGSRVLRVPSDAERTESYRAAALAEQLPQGVQNGFSRLDGAPAMLEVVPLNYDGLRLTAAVPLTTVFQHWYATRNAVLLGALLFSLLLLGGAALMQVYLRRMQRAQQQVLESGATLHSAMDSIAVGFLQLDVRHKVVHWNPRYEEMFPRQCRHLAHGRLWSDVLVDTLAEADEQQRSEQVQLRRLQQAWDLGDSVVAELSTADGLMLQLSQRATPDGGRVITCEDITEIRTATAEIENLAFYDPLTGLPNRRLLLDRLGQAIHLALRAGWLGALMFVDLNKFKVLNDTQGHEVGDMLLQEVAQRLRNAIRVSDTVARLGGDEFVVMLCDLPADLEEAARLTERIAEKIVHRLREPYLLGSYVHRGTASLGVTLFGQAPVEVSELLKQADIAMYQAKSQQAVDVCFFEPHMQEVINARARMEADLRQALTLEQFVLHYQLQILADGSIDGIEALIRWEHPERGMVLPSAFIPVAEDSELIVQIGQWVLRAACQQLARWQNLPQLAGVDVAVNVSARQFRQQDFVQQVQRALKDSGVAPSLLRLELTEALVIDDMNDSITKMDALRTLGVRFAIDDFGTGKSSLFYLTRLPLSQLKIDQSFVRHLGVSHTDDVVAQTIIGMAHNLGLTVIAEGVELQEQIDSLLRFGCQRFQGHFFCRPLSAASLQGFVETMPPLSQVMQGGNVLSGQGRLTLVASAQDGHSASGGDDDATHDECESLQVVELGELGQHQGGEHGSEHRDQIGEEARYSRPSA
jgi:diguanylate cyclase (GGDEF)-like protein